LHASGRAWLADTLDLLGHGEWARLTRLAGEADRGDGATEATGRDWR